ncbi:molybdate ABC transporter substrate-binding protein [Heliobacterium gestii]|uniref:Molybdate ABC transporter substrate-binding protein n=1 Tax=Heliomicrobium gestii TaxID=2699 RepID=A0A845L5D5_HELGE|nr:molybdate ABC transporter substrate-binding protein [Heliomicrobium gestii]MBM7865572.1 molybdate transport system substrate-binding protein [Heliomicrobium gestii]MZP41822.1 molybdate ABC transporter substrate-binding protein [Heliomicrobium gestii]
MNKRGTWARLGRGAVLLALAAALLTGCGGQGGPGGAAENRPAAVKPAPSGQPLFAYVGAGLKEPVTEIAAQYEAQTGVKIELTFNNSGALLSQAETAKKGDIYIPGGKPFVEAAQKKGIIENVVGPIAYHVPAIITPKGNPAGIRDVRDLTRPGLKLVLPDKEATAIGKNAFKTFEQLGITAAVEKNILATVETLPKVSAMIGMGQGDAGIAEYSSVSNQKDKLEVLEIDPAVNVIDEIPCASLTFSTQKEQAKDFLSFMQKEGPGVFKKFGFKVPQQ